MYASFNEDEVSFVPAIEVPFHEQSETAPFGSDPTSVSVHETEPAPAASGVGSRVEAIAAAHSFISQFSGPPPAQWRRYRYKLPSTVAEVRLLPAGLETPQQMQLRSTTFVLPLSDNPEDGNTYEFCSKHIDYIITHVKYAQGFAPLIGLRFIKLGAEIAQCVVTVGNNDIGLTRTLVANLNQVGVRAAFAAEKVIMPTATLYVWDLTKFKNPAAEPITAEELLVLFDQPPPPTAPPGTETVTVVKGFEEGTWFVCFKRPDPCFNWLMNTMAASSFQKELYDSLNLFVTLAPCEHDWAPSRRTLPGMPSDIPSYEQHKSMMAAQSSGANREADGDELPGDDEDFAELAHAKIDVDIFGQVKKTAATSSYTVPELVRDDDDDEMDDGSFMDMPYGDYGHFQPPVLSSDMSGLPQQPPPMYWETPESNFGPIFPSYGDPSMPPPPVYNFAAPVSQPLLPAPITIGNVSTGGLFPIPYQASGVFPLPPPVNVQVHVAPPESDAFPVPEIIVPTVHDPVAKSQRDAVVARLTTADPRRVVALACEPENHKVLMSLFSDEASMVDDELHSSSDESDAKRHALSSIETVVRVFLQTLPSNSAVTPAGPSSKKEGQVVVDLCWHERNQTNIVPLLCQMLLHPAATELQAIIANRIVGHFHQLQFKRLTEALLAGDRSETNPLVASFCNDPLQWCIDATLAIPQHVVAHPHLMVPFGLNGVRTMFEKASPAQRTRIEFCFQSIGSETLKEMLHKAEMVARTVISTAALSDVISSNWLIDKLGMPPADNRNVGLIVDLSTVVVYGRKETLISDTVVEFSGMYCANLSASSTVSDEVKLDFLHNTILRRLFSPAQTKYSLLQSAFFAQLDKIGGKRDEKVAQVLTSASWPERPKFLPAINAAKPQPPSGGLLPLPSIQNVAPPSKSAKEADPDLVRIEFAWNENWSAVLSQYPPTGDPFPQLPGCAPDADGAAQGNTPVVWKSGVSKSYGHYYFKLDDKTVAKVKTSYKHPETHQEYMVAPQAFVINAEKDGEFVRTGFLQKYNVDETRFTAWLADQRLRDKDIDEAVLKEMKITYRQSSSANVNESVKVTDASSILRSQRDLERKLRFVQDLKYPDKGHPFPPLPKGWTCSLSTSNGLYYFRSTGGKHSETTYEHPKTKEEYAPTPQAYAFFEKYTSSVLQQKLEHVGVTPQRIDDWLKDQRVRDIDIDYYVVEKLGVRYGSRRSKRHRSNEPRN